MQSRILVLCAALLALFVAPSGAVPPLVIGDVEPAEYRHWEIYLGQRITEKSNGDEKTKSHIELVYGIRPGQEVCIDAPYIQKESNGADVSGWGDICIGTKIQYSEETATRPAMGVSLEVKLDNGSAEDGLGSGVIDVDLCWRAEKWFGKSDTILNIGHTFVGNTEVGGVRTYLPNVTHWALAVRRPVNGSLRLLGEIYGSTREEHGGNDMLGFNIGFSYKDKAGTRWHAAWGQGLGSPSRQELKSRVYLGTKWTY